MPAGFFWLLAAQFLSGLADHAVLIVAIAYLQEQRHPLWWAPLLKFAFTWSYVLLAPVAGAWADAVRKNVLMGRMNALKALAVAGAGRLAADHGAAAGVRGGAGALCPGGVVQPPHPVAAGAARAAAARLAGAVAALLA